MIILGHFLPVLKNVVFFDAAEEASKKGNLPNVKPV
jgi:hypothetical protein